MKKKKKKKLNSFVFRVLQYAKAKEEGEEGEKHNMIRYVLILALWNLDCN